MTYALWHRDRQVGIASARSVLRAAEVPLMAQAGQLCEQLDALLSSRAAQLEAALAEARARGHAEGLAEGQGAARDEVAAALLAHAEAARATRESLRRDVAALSLQVARKLLGSLAADARLVALAETAAAEIVGDPALTLVVHLRHEEAVRARLAQVGAAARFEVRGEPGCADDHCRIESEFGIVDASLSNQLERLAAAWKVAP